MMASLGPSRAAYELTGALRWEDVDLVRKGIECFARVVLRDDMRTHAVSMVAGELLENAIKHGANDEPVGLEVRMQNGDLRIIVRSAGSAMEGGVDGLREIIDWIHSFDHPLEAYQQRIRDVVRSGHAGGLGLVRIAHEGHCALDYEIDPAANTVSVVARFL